VSVWPMQLSPSDCVASGLAPTALSDLFCHNRSVALDFSESSNFPVATACECVCPLKNVGMSAEDCWALPEMRGRAVGIIDPPLAEPSLLLGAMGVFESADEGD
jgi:hypothetical protein